MNTGAMLAHARALDALWQNEQVGYMPERFGTALLTECTARNAAGNYAGNAFILDAGERHRKALPISASNDDIIAYASARADECLRMTGIYKHAEAALAAMRQLCDRIGVKSPDCNDDRGQLARFVCPLWWRRAVRKATGRAIEKTAIQIGLVHRKAGIYASDETVFRRGQQRRRNRALLGTILAVNEAGQEYTLQELSDLGISNPEIRRGELMTRIAGFETIARSLGHAGEFYTITAPSKYHARRTKSGDKNPKYNDSTPREAQLYLRKVWSRIRAAMKREQIAPYGFRVVEAHHDGTPHWHALFFMPAQQVARAREIVAKYATAEDRAELGSDISPRFKSVEIDHSRGTAAGYIAKYIAKNIDGFGVGDDLEGFDAKDSSARVDAWAACWGIRQFQQIGGAPVSVWRELRRLEAGPGDSTIDKAARAADLGDWAGFLRAMGGGRVRVWRTVAEQSGRYGDTVLTVAGLVDQETGEQIKTRFHTWEIKRGEKNGHAGILGEVLDVGLDLNRVNLGGSGGVDLVFEVGPILAPWSSVNNCTRGGEKSEGDDETGKRGGGIAATGDENSGRQDDRGNYRAAR